MQLAKGQFDKLAEELKPTGPEDAGFTVKHTTGHRPSSGYAVSLAGTEKELQAPEVSGEAVRDYTQAHNASLSQRGVYLGGWAPGKGQPWHGTAALDNTRIIRSRKTATNEMVMENQKTMHHLNTGDTISNVFRQVPTTFEEPKGFDREGFERDVADLYRRKAGRLTLAADEASRQAAK